MKNKILSKIFYTVLVAFLLLNVACPEGCNIVTYDVTGEWKITKTMEDNTTEELTFLFYGSRESGEVYWNDIFIGRFTYTNAILAFQITLPDSADVGHPIYLETYSGKFEDDNNLNGDVAVVSDPIVYGTWTGTRLN